MSTLWRPIRTAAFVSTMFYIYLGGQHAQPAMAMAYRCHGCAARPYPLVRSLCTVPAFMYVWIRKPSTLIQVSSCCPQQVKQCSIVQRLIAAAKKRESRHLRNLISRGPIRSKPHRHYEPTPAFTSLSMILLRVMAWGKRKMPKTTSMVLLSALPSSQSTTASSPGLRRNDFSLRYS